MRMKLFLWTALVALAVTAGCASDQKLGATECKAVDWYKYGFRDGSASAARSNLEHYNRECAGSGVTPDAAAYNKGLGDGIASMRGRRNF
jgi:outer membrane protein assembly factor BamD (BamD/ComL family)